MLAAVSCDEQVAGKSEGGEATGRTFGGLLGGLLGAGLGTGLGYGGGYGHGYGNGYGHGYPGPYGNPYAYTFKKSTCNLTLIFFSIYILQVWWISSLWGIWGWISTLWRLSPRWLWGIWLWLRVSICCLIQLNSIPTNNLFSDFYDRPYYG